jgi:dynein heavy chain
MMMSTVNNFKGKPEALMRLFVHESLRTFEDRLINSIDIETFRKYVEEGIQKSFPQETYSKYVSDKENIFTSFIAVHNGSEKAYVQIAD